MSYRIRRVEIDICEACLLGQGKRCSTPGCALMWHSVDLPIAFQGLDGPQVYKTIRIFQYDDKNNFMYEVDR